MRDKKFIISWILFWSIVTILTFLYCPRPGTIEHEVVCVGLNQRAWTIVQELFPGDDPRNIISKMERLNPGKDLGTLKPGELIKIPVEVK